MRFRFPLAIITLAAFLLPHSVHAQTQQYDQQVQQLGRMNAGGGVQQASFGGCNSCGAASPAYLGGGGGCSSCSDLWSGYDSCAPSCGPRACGLIGPTGPVCAGSAIVGELLCGIKNTVDGKLSCLLDCVFSPCGPGGCSPCGFGRKSAFACGDSGCDGGCAAGPSCGAVGPSCGMAAGGAVGTADPYVGMPAPAYGGSAIGTMQPIQALPGAPSGPAVPSAAGPGNPFVDDPVQPSVPNGSTTRRPVYSVRRTSYDEPVRQAQRSAQPQRAMQRQRTMPQRSLQRQSQQPAGQAQQPMQQQQRVGSGVLGPFTPQRNSQVRRNMSAASQTYAGSRPLVRFQDSDQ